MSWKVLSLCSGGGGLEEGVSMGLARMGIDTSVSCWVERDPGARAVLRSRMLRGEITASVLWPDVESFPIEDWDNYIDIVTAGYPCQPFATQGKRRAENDHRWLWPTIWRIVRAIRPRLVVLENVQSHLHKGKGFGRVVGDLASSGWRAAWDCVPACAVGSPQRRDRVFLVAAPDPDWLRAALADPRSAGLSRGIIRGTAASSIDARTPRPRPLGDPAAAASLVQALGDHGAQEPTTHPAGIGGSWAESPSGPVVVRVAHGLAARVHGARVRTLGNGVAPQAAARAVEILVARLIDG